ncbi:MAG: tetratricopeptide repeat protein [Prevotellaceae bacterium]|jgi:tetratricopeptide (TPR) repeat protein|nr:tetratricopeptide repeat protein [Prevotellaceae bacterium]
MKTLGIVIAVVISTLLGFSSQAQPGKFGKTPQDSIECLLCINAYQTEYKNKNYKAAIVEWRNALAKCPPKSSRNLYVHGRVLIKDAIDKTSDPVLRKARIDTLIMLYENDMANFNTPKATKADLFFRKASDLEEYSPDNKQAIYDGFIAAIETDKNYDLRAAAKAMLTARSMYEQGKFTADQFIQVYTQMAEIAETQCAANSADSDKYNYKLAIESAFLTTDAAGCDNLIKVLTPRFNENKGDINVVKSTAVLLTSKECTDNQLYYDAVEEYNRLDPSPGASYGLARMYYTKGDKEKANEYFKSATETETDKLRKSTYFQEFGGLALKDGNVLQAISYARQSIAANPRNGKSHLLLGMAYASYKNCTDDDKVGKKSVFWVAVDQLDKAKRLEPDLASEANKYINMYSQHFPSTPDAFFYNLLKGDKYQVECGPINEWTTVRTRD